MSFGKRKHIPSAAPSSRKPTMSAPRAPRLPGQAGARRPFGLVPVVAGVIVVAGLGLVAMRLLPGVVGGGIDAARAGTGGPQPAATPPAGEEASAGRPRPPQSRDRNVVYAETGDPAIAAAREKARAGLDAFFARAEKPEPGETGFVIKAGLPSADGSVENIWVRDVVATSTGFRGRLANDPQALPGLRAGSAVTFTREQIGDWMYVRSGLIVGNETGRVLVARMPPAERDRMMARFAPQ